MDLMGLSVIMLNCNFCFRANTENKWWSKNQENNNISFSITLGSVIAGLYCYHLSFCMYIRLSISCSIYVSIN